MEHKKYRGTVALPSGVDNFTIATCNMPMKPIAGVGHIMKQGAGADNILATCDYESLNVKGGDFHFAIIPADSTTYVLFYEFTLL